MRTVISILSIAFICFGFNACSGDDAQSGTDQSAPNTLASLINPEAPATNTAATPVRASSNSLNDIWVLTRIQSNETYNVNLTSNIPILQLDTASNTLTGHSGCNSFGGKFKVTANRFSLNGVRLTSNQGCNDKGFEKKLIGTLKSGNVVYRLASDSLYLNVGGGSEFVYRRIGRS